MIGARTGGIGTALLFEQRPGPDGAVGAPLAVTAHFALRGKATVDKVGELFELKRALLADANLDDAQAKAIELLRETRASGALLLSGDVHHAALMGVRGLAAAAPPTTAQRGGTYGGGGVARA